MAQEEKTPKTPLEIAQEAQAQALKAAMEQAQAMYGNIPGFQGMDIAAMQAQLMKETAELIPGVAEAQAYQAQMMAEAGTDPEALRESYQKNLEWTQKMMQEAAAAGFTEEQMLGIEDDEDYELVIKGDGALSAEQRHLLAYGAPILVFNRDYIDSLESVTDTDTLKEMLEEWWEVSDHDSAMETVAWLFNEGHHSDGDPAIAEIKGRGLDAITDSEKEDEDNKIGDAYNVAIQFVEEEGKPLSELPDTISGWDLVRAVNIARWAYICGYFSESEMWDVIRNVADAAKSIFSSWKEYGTSFSVGRGVWRGDEMDYEVAEEALVPLYEDPASPWKEFTW